MQVLKVIELMANSDKSWEDAAQKAIKKASKTVQGISSINIQNMSAKVENNKIVEYRINAKLTFRLNEK